MKNNNTHKLVAVLIVLLMWGGIYAQREWQKTVITPGNPVLYHGKRYDIDLMEIDNNTHKSKVRLSGNSVMISADSVTNPYKPFWRL